MGIRAIGVSYGYGSIDELTSTGADEIAGSVEELRSILLPGEKKPRGLFITFEGADGCGKSTQMQLLKERLEECGYEIVCSREPGGCEISECIRDVVLDPKHKGMSAACEALLFAASRAEHVRQVILPAIENGKIMLCDRFLDSSFAYQARGRELGDDFIRQINVPASAVTPDRTLLFVGKREEISQRLRSHDGLDRIEQEQDCFVCRVYEAYDEIAAAAPERVHIIDSNRSIEEIFEDVQRDLSDIIG
ncbi:MAG: dTMP kinase [Clostridia bacterium]|nr:dTMP kinase [Clostridia bacterium]